MGDPIVPIVIVPGLPCITCWGDGKEFELPTPEEVTMGFHDWIEGPLWNEMYRAELSSPVVLSNVILGACSYQGFTEHFMWGWGLPPAETQMMIKDKAPAIGWAFFSQVASICLTEMQNQIGPPMPHYTIGGYCSIIFGS